MASVYENQDDYAISTYLFEHEPLEVALQTIAKTGFSHVELWADVVHLDPRLGPDVDRIKRLLHTLSLVPHALHTPFHRFLKFSGNEEGRIWRKTLWKHSFDICSELEIPIAVIHAMNRSEYNYAYSDLAYVYDLLFELSEYADGRGVKLALENISSSPVPDDEVLCTLSEQTQLFKSIPNLFYCLDIGHVTITNNDMKAEIDSSIDRLITLHIHNNDGSSDTHDLPDNGVIDWPYWFDYLRGNGYDGQFVFEISCGEDPFERLRQLEGLFNGGMR